MLTRSPYFWLGCNNFETLRVSYYIPTRAWSEPCPPPPPWAAILAACLGGYWFTSHVEVDMQHRLPLICISHTYLPCFGERQHLVIGLEWHMCVCFCVSVSPVNRQINCGWMRCNKRVHYTCYVCDVYIVNMMTLRCLDFEGYKCIVVTYTDCGCD